VQRDIEWQRQRVPPDKRERLDELLGRTRLILQQRSSNQVYYNSDRIMLIVLKRVAFVLEAMNLKQLGRPLYPACRSGRQSSPIFMKTYLKGLGPLANDDHTEIRDWKILHQLSIKLLQPDSLRQKLTQILDTVAAFHVTTQAVISILEQMSPTFNVKASV
jgi:hypothetical protein